MDNSKPWYTSTGIWGALLTIVSPAIAGLAHVTINPGDLTQSADYLAQLGTVVGGVVALIGRVKATHTVS